MSLLEQLVEGKDIAVIAKNPKCAGLDFQDKVVVRFNNDSGRADIWCTALHRGRNEELLDSCSLVVVPHPLEDETVRGHFTASSEWLDKPVEFCDPRPYSELRNKLNATPLTGTAFLHMLRGLNNFRSCTVYGFDAHLTPGAQVTSFSVYYNHKPLMDHRYIRYLVLFDSRFRAGKHTRLFWPEIWWNIRRPKYFLDKHAPVFLEHLKNGRLIQAFSRLVEVLRGKTGHQSSEK